MKLHLALVQKISWNLFYELWLKENYDENHTPLPKNVMLSQHEDVKYAESEILVKMAENVVLRINVESLIPIGCLDSVLTSFC